MLVSASLLAGACGDKSEPTGAEREGAHTPAAPDDERAEPANLRSARTKRPDPKYLEALRTGTGEEKRHAVQQLAFFVEDLMANAELVGMLAAIVKDENEDEYARKSAIEFLRRSDDRGGPILIEALLDASYSKNSDVRDCARLELDRVRALAPESVPLLVAALDNRDIDMVAGAVELLSRAGAAAGPAVTKLVPLLRRNDRPALVASVGATLAAIGRGSAGAALELADAFVSSSGRATLSIGSALLVIGAADPRVAEHINAALTTTDSDKLAITARILAMYGEAARPSVRDLAATLTREPIDADARVEVLHALRSIPHDHATTVASVSVALRSNSERVRMAAAEALGSGTDASVAAAESLTLVLADDSEKVRVAALEAIATLRTASPAAVKAVGALLSDPSAVVRKAAVKALEAIGDLSGAAMSFLAEAAARPDSDIAVDAERVLMRLPNAPDAKDLTIPAQDADPRFRRYALLKLGSYEERQRRAGSISAVVLAARLRDEDVEVRRLALETIGPERLRGMDATPALTRMIAESDPDTVVIACRAIGRYGADAAGAAEVLAKRLPLSGFAEASPNTAGWPRLSDPNGVDLRNPILRALGQIGPGARRAVPILIGTLSSTPSTYGDPFAGLESTLRAIGSVAIDDSNGLLARVKLVPVSPFGQATPTRVESTVFRVRCWLVRALSELPELPSPKFPALLASLLSRDVDINMRVAAASALARLGVENLDALIVALSKGDHDSTREAAARAIASLGKGATRALPELERATHDEAPSVRLAAAAALKSVR